MEKYRVKRIGRGTWMIGEGNLDCMYLLEGEWGAILIDTGVGSGDLAGVLRELTVLPIRVILTHGHRDHAGGAGQFASVFVHPADRELAGSVTFAQRSEYIQRICGSTGRYRAEDFLCGMEAGGGKTEFLPLTGGTVFSFGGRELEILDTPGHTRGSVSFLDRSAGILFPGDALQSLMLLLTDEEDRSGYMEWWLGHLKRLEKRVDSSVLFAGGHGIIPYQNLPNLIRCGEEILAGRLEARLGKAYIYTNYFYSYRDIHLFYGPEIYRESPHLP